MDIIDILGGLVGGKARGGSPGGKILREIIKQSTQRETPSAPAPAPRTPAPRSPAPRRSPPADATIEGQARELEDLLGIANDRQARRAPAPSAPRSSPSTAPRPTANTDSYRPTPTPRAPEVADDPRQAQALVLVQAMVNAAKADGQISQPEQQRIIEQLGETSPDAIAFLRAEFAKPLDVRNFALNVPLGMEQQVYTISLAAIDVDTPSESNYLAELARCLRLPPEVCAQIHRRFNLPAPR